MRTPAAVLALFNLVILTAAQPITGKPSPSLTIRRAGSSSIQLSQYRGKIVLLAFINTECSHCQDLTRELIPIAREYEARGVQIVECAFNTNAVQAMPGFIRQFQPTFPVGYADNNSVVEYLGRSISDPIPVFVPHLVLIDRHGKIQGDFAPDNPILRTPGPSLRAELDKLLKLK